jgi:integrase
LHFNTQELRAFVLLAAFGGLRRGELLALTRRDIDLLHRSVEVRSQRQETRGGHTLISPPKTDAGRRRIVLAANLLPEIETHLEHWTATDPAAVLFAGARGGPLRLCVWQREWTRARRAVGLEQLHFHDLRHVAGTMAAATGASTKELMHRLGHASPRAALRYQHATAMSAPAVFVHRFRSFSYSRSGVFVHAFRTCRTPGGCVALA